MFSLFSFLNWLSFRNFFLLLLFLQTSKSKRYTRKTLDTVQDYLYCLKEAGRCDIQDEDNVRCAVNNFKERIEKYHGPHVHGLGCTNCTQLVCCQTNLDILRQCGFNDNVFDALEILTACHSNHYIKVKEPRLNCIAAAYYPRIFKDCKIFGTDIENLQDTIDQKNIV